MQLIELSAANRTYLLDFRGTKSGRRGRGSYERWKTGEADPETGGTSHDQSPGTMRPCVFSSAR